MLYAFYMVFVLFREACAIYVGSLLLEEGAHLHIYDPKVPREQIYKYVSESGLRDRHNGLPYQFFNYRNVLHCLISMQLFLFFYRELNYCFEVTLITLET